jgi:hypothetical protein
MGSLAAGGAAAMGTGAFSSVEADRSVSVAVENDADAYLGLQPLDNSNANQYVSSTDGTVEINIGGSGNGGTGVNKNAVTKFNELFEITNQGTQSVLVYITYDPNDGQEGFPDVTGTPGNEKDPNGMQDLEFFTGDSDDEILNYPEGQSANAYGLGVGDSHQVGLRLDTRDHPNLNDSDPLFSGEVTLTAVGLE